jgi:hypothetical protein
MRHIVMFWLGSRNRHPGAVHETQTPGTLPFHNKPSSPTQSVRVSDQNQNRRFILHAMSDLPLLKWRRFTLPPALPRHLILFRPTSLALKQFHFSFLSISMRLLSRRIYTQKSRQIAHIATHNT